MSNVRDDRTTTVDVCDVCLLFITAPYISDIWYSCTYRSRCRACCSDNTRAPVKRYSGDISHKEVTGIALWLFTRRPAHTPLAAAAVPLDSSANDGHCQSANVFVFNQLYCWTTSSWTWSRFHVVLKLLNSDVFQSALGHNIVEVWRLMSRPQCVCRHSVIVVVRGVVVRLSSTPIVDRCSLQSVTASSLYWNSWRGRGVHVGRAVTSFRALLSNTWLWINKMLGFSPFWATWYILGMYVEQK